MRTGEGSQALPEPPPPLKQTSPYTVELREGGGCMAVFGLPFFVAGVVLALAGAGILPMKNTPQGKWSPLFFALMSLAFLGVGGALIFGRRWLRLDVIHGSVVRRRGLLVPMQSSERRLSEFTAVVIAFQPGDSDSPDRYPVRLRPIHGDDFVVHSPTLYKEARREAEYLSRFLRLALADTTTDNETLVNPERAGETLQQRLRSGGAESERAVPPPVTRCQVRESGGAVTIVIPGPKHRLASGLAVIIPVVILVIVIPAMLRFFSRSATPAGVQAVFLIFTVLMFVVPSIIASVNLMAGGRRKTVVTASPAGLLIEKQGPWRNATKRVSADDILDLDYSTFEGRLAAARKSSPMPAAGGVTEQIFASLKEWVPTKGIIVKSRQELITFGEGLPAEELHYIKAILRKVLGGRVT